MVYINYDYENGGVNPMNSDYMVDPSNVKTVKLSVFKLTKGEYAKLDESIDLFAYAMRGMLYTDWFANHSGKLPITRMIDRYQDRCQQRLTYGPLPTPYDWMMDIYRWASHDIGQYDVPNTSLKASYDVDASNRLWDARTRPGIQHLTNAAMDFLLTFGSDALENEFYNRNHHELISNIFKGRLTIDENGDDLSKRFKAGNIVNIPEYGIYDRPYFCHSKNAHLLHNRKYMVNHIRIERLAPIMGMDGIEHRKALLDIELVKAPRFKTNSSAERGRQGMQDDPVLGHQWQHSTIGAHQLWLKKHQANILQRAGFNLGNNPLI